ncbi:hypothetical protein A3K63_00830 [Candidatus Micrarchaeota archaeon RBG_16_49_10]|nr:MAG: hypothetical protein A3K63_00830 [Candidatus Micrarchaeota archaeon RBG_16_49_10]
MIPYEEMMDGLKEKSGLSKKELDKKVSQKYEELGGLVSMEGAAHLVARELGINLLVKKRKLKISDLKDGMKSVDITGRVSMITEPREFSRKDGTKGKVSNIFVSDGAGSIRIPLWDKQVDDLKGKIQEGEVISISNGLVKINNFGNIELRVSTFSKIEKVQDDGSIPFEKPNARPLAVETDINMIKEGFFSVKGNIVQLFKINFTYKMCPKCRMKIEEEDCPEHGKVKPETNMLVSAVIDDGTGNLRVVFFREQAKRLSGIEPNVLSDLGQDAAYDALKKAVLGRDVVVSGRVQRNKLFENLEIVANDVQEINPVEEGKRLIDEIKTLVGGYEGGKD